MSLSGLAAKINYSRGYISKIETGAAPANEAFARRCDHFFGTGGTLTAQVRARTASAARQKNGTVPGSQGWYLGEFRAVLRMDAPTPEAHERRRIVATRDGLTEVMAWLDVPRKAGLPRPALAVEVLFGGRLVRREQINNRFHLMIQLPTPLRRGEEHEYGLILRVPEGEPMRPHYIFTPECRCDIFDLRVRFAPERLPLWIRKVTAETVRTFDDPEPTQVEQLTVDRAGEVRVRFRNPTLYLGYGLQWG